ncbi:hypothetical protein VM98_39040, partial [Streptomyces rubellomurinus subsp. indigoferus]
SRTRGSVAASTYGRRQVFQHVYKCCPRWTSWAPRRLPIERSTVSAFGRPRSGERSISRYAQAREDDDRSSSRTDAAATVPAPPPATAPTAPAVPPSLRER